MLREEDKFDFPFVSVIMPLRNEADFIERSLRAAFRQSYPADCLEIVIADGQSTDDTLVKIQILKRETEIPIMVVNNPTRIASAASIIAVGNAEGNIVGVDGHCEIDKDYVANWVKYL